MSSGDELERLRDENESLRNQIIDDLRARLEDAERTIDDLRHQVEHYRSEAHRLDGVGREMASEYNEVRAKLKAMEALDAERAARGQGPSRAVTGG